MFLFYFESEHKFFHSCYLHFPWSNALWIYFIHSTPLRVRKNSLLTRFSFLSIEHELKAEKTFFLFQSGAMKNCVCFCSYYIYLIVLKVLFLPPLFTSLIFIRTLFNLSLKVLFLCSIVKTSFLIFWNMIKCMQKAFLQWNINLINWI